MLGILVPPSFVLPLFGIFTWSMVQFSLYGAYRLRSAVYHIESLQDKPLVTKALQKELRVDPHMQEWLRLANRVNEAKSLLQSRAETSKESQAGSSDSKGS